MPSTTTNPEPSPAAGDPDQQYKDELTKFWDERKAQRQSAHIAAYEARKAELDTSPPAPEPSADPYAGMDGDLAKVLRSLGATIKARQESEASGHQGETEPAPEPQPPAAPEVPAVGQVILFPQWGDERRAAPAAIFRAALFPPLNFQKGRPYLEEAQIYATKGIEIYFTGKQFDQSDLDVYLELLHIAREYPFGVECCFTAYGLLKALGRATGQKDHKWLHSVLIRLCAGVVDMTDHKTRYFGHLVESGIKDEVTKHYRVRLNPDMARVFRGDLWASLDIQQRRDLKQNQTAKAIHAYLSSHANPGPIRYETLAEIIGLKNSNGRQLKSQLVKGYGMLKEVGFLADFEAGTDTITPKVNHTPSQTRHLIKKATGCAGKAQRRENDTKTD